MSDLVTSKVADVPFFVSGQGMHLHFTHLIGLGQPLSMKHHPVLQPCVRLHHKLCLETTDSPWFSNQLLPHFIIIERKTTVGGTLQAKTRSPDYDSEYATAIFNIP